MRHVRFVLRAAALASAAVLLPCCDNDIGSGDEFAIMTARVSVKLFGQEVAAASNDPSISRDGRYVAFASSAVNLTEGDSNGLIDIFVKDRLTGEVENITNIVPSTSQVLADCELPSISADGQFVAFVSVGNFTDDPAIPGANTIKHIFVFDRQAGIFRTVWLGGPVPNDNEAIPSLSEDGRFLAFTSAATNFAGFTNVATRNQVWVCDFGAPPTFPTRTISLVSHNETDLTFSTGGNAGSAIGRIAANASFVSFGSAATNLASADDADGNQDVYLWERATGAVTLASILDPSNTPAGRANFFGVVSGDGTAVAYMHRPGGILASQEMRLFHIGSGLTETIGDPAVTPANFDFTYGISDDGQSVVYTGNTVGGTTSQVYVWNAQTGNRLLSASSGGTQGNKNSFHEAISGDGRWGVWETTSSNLVTGDTNGFSDIFVRGSLR
jgi:Tol biopolymer transport system component